MTLTMRLLRAAAIVTLRMNGWSKKLTDRPTDRPNNKQILHYTDATDACLSNPPKKGIFHPPKELMLAINCFLYAMNVCFYAPN